MESIVSVLIPCYNGEKFLERCFNCLLLQEYEYVQIIIVNDGSTDRSEEIIKKYKNKFMYKGYGFDYIYQKNAGAAAAINVALKLVKGKYIMLYDVDDIITTTAISEKAQFLENNYEYDMVRNNGYYVNNEEIDKSLGLFIEDDKEKYNENIFEDLIYGRTNNWPASFMVRTDSLFSRIEEKEIYISQFGQNLQIMLPVAYYGKSGFIDKPLMKYIKHSESHSSCTSIEKKLRLINGYEENRLEIIKNMKIEKKNFDEYIKNIKIMYCRIRMKLAFDTNDKKLLKKEYNSLKQYGVLNLNDRILYYRFFNPIYDNFYKVYMKSIYIAGRIKRGIQS